MWACSACVANGDPGGTACTSLDYPVVPAAPFDTAGYNSCQAGHYAGLKGDDGDGVNPWSDPSFCPGYSNAGMGVAFEPGQTAVDITSANYLGFTPTKIRMRVKAGPTNNPAQSYLLVITLAAATCPGCEFQHRISGLTSTWTTIEVPFPAVGTLGLAGGDAALDTTFGQFSWIGAANEISWSYNFKMLAFGVEVDEMAFNLFVDNIEFVP